MRLYLYIDRRTALHELNPTVKVLAMLCFFLAAFVNERPALLLPLGAGVMTLVRWAGAWPNVHRLRVMFVMVFTMTLLIWTLFYPRGEPWLTFGPIQIRTGAIEFALGMSLKLATVLAVGVLFLSTTKVEEFAYALTRVGVPYKLGFTMTLAFRLVPVFVEAAFTVVQAQRSRGFNFDEGNPLQRVRRYVPVMVPVFMGALRRADGMAMALEARGFLSQQPRTSFEQYRFGFGDVIALLLTLLVTSVFVAFWWIGYTRVGM
ncbi:MAG: energy-coupling factor transporter transmembrane protein EcfT [Deltaproteobacteria bacterium]|nr:energy-coupling factor transporter transmembrane protein EcfT [Deltaproteobacteria bacterium]MBI3386750.1 energy-coupling factor transporter transmembrane protein EcfT [Deltaproteobacteria bacterium]